MMLSYPDQPCPQEEGRERVKNPSYPNLEKEALFYLAWAGFMNRIHFVGASRPHTPICDATPPPPKIPRGFRPRPGVTCGHLQILSNWVWVVCGRPGGGSM